MQRLGSVLCHGTEAQAFVRQTWILADLEWSTGGTAAAVNEPQVS